MNKRNKNFEMDEINLIDLTKKIWNGRKNILLISSFFFIIGLIIIFISPKEFTASSTFIPQTSKSNSGSRLSGLASIAGFNLDAQANGGDIPTSLYPQILNSVPVKRLILDSKIPYDTTTQTYSNYLLNQSPSILSLLKKYTIGLPSLIINLFNNKNILIKEENNLMKVSIEEKMLFEILNKQIELSVNDKEGFVQLLITSNDPKIAAILTSQIQEILQERIIDYKIQHAREFLKFTEKQYFEKQKAYYKLLEEVAISKDKNINVSSERYQSQLKQKEGELLISQSVYQELASQLERAKLQVAENTPIFSTINPVTIPTGKSAPNRKMILIVYTFLGIIISIVYVLTKDNLSKIWIEINK